jgi:hypothetical protein
MDQWAVLLVVIVLAASLPLVALSYVGFQAAAEFKDVSGDVAVGPWQSGAVPLTVGDTGLADLRTEWVGLVVTDAEGTLYFTGAPGQSQRLPGTDARVSVTYFDADGDGFATAGDRVTVVVEGTGANPLEGGHVQVWFGLRGYALEDLP